MKKIITYIAQDGLEFGSPEECVGHEFMFCPEVSQSMQAAMDTLHESHQSRWCMSQICGCMGCANHAVHSAGLTQEHWQYWKENIRPPSVQNEGNYELILKSINNKRTEAIMLIRYLTGLSVLEAQEALESKVLYRWDNYQKVKQTKDRFSLIGIDTAITCDGKPVEEKYYQIIKIDT